MVEKCNSKNLNVKIDKPKGKPKHQKSNSNVSEFAFAPDSMLDEQLENFVNNYEGK